MIAAGPWISVAERTPEERKLVLARASTGTIMISFYEHDYGWTAEQVGWFENVTHWAEVIPPVLCDLCIDPIDKPHVDEHGAKRWRACQNEATHEVNDEKGRTLRVCEAHLAKETS